MKRITSNELVSLLICPECGEKLMTSMGDMECVGCHCNITYFYNKPVLIKKNNELFPPSAYQYSDGENVGRSNKISVKAIIKKVIPSKSVNLARERLFERFSNDCCSSEKRILVVGCGNQSLQLERLFQACGTVFVFCDIDKEADADIFCDSHSLPFISNGFDGVVSTAVLEHVLYPEKVISEIYRVLKDDGLIYSEIPFLQSVHEGAYDFTRFTMSGHRRLLEYFTEIDSGVVAGPGTALVWSIDDFFKSLSSNKRVSRLLSIISRLLFFWLKYFDYLTKNNSNAVNAASCTYFYGSKSVRRISANEIINFYKGNIYRHI